MKKVLLTVFAILGIAVLLPATAFAAKPAVTDVTGVVTNGSAGVKGVSVNVVCGSYSKTDKTNASGSYRVQFNAKKCPAGSSVTVTATTKGGLNGTSIGTVSPDGSAKLNVAMVNVTVGLPEMGAFTGSAAALATGGAFFVTRRRKLAQE